MYQVEMEETMKSGNYCLNIVSSLRKQKSFKILSLKNNLRFSVNVPLKQVSKTFICTTDLGQHTNTYVSSRSNVFKCKIKYIIFTMTDN